jgi:hypothetical protein
VVLGSAEHVIPEGHSNALLQFFTQKLPPGKVAQVAPNPHASVCVASHGMVQVGVGKSSSSQQLCPEGHVAPGAAQLLST